MSNSRTFDALVALANIKATAGSNDKKALLQKYSDMEELMYALKLAYDPYLRTGIGLKKLGKPEGEVIVGPVTIDMVTLYEYFRNHPTGSSADVRYAHKFIAQFSASPQAQEIASQLVTKTLKIGITAKTLNKVYGEDFIPLIGIMRGKHYEDRKSKVKGPFIVTEKIDGIRRLLVKENGIVSMYSRSGIPDEGLVDIEAEAAYLPDNCVYDGELTAIGEFENAIELRQASSSIANRKGNRTGLHFNIFDMVPIADYKRGKSTHDARTRKVMLGAMFGDENIECLIPNTYKGAIATHVIRYNFKFIKVVPILGVAMTDLEIEILVTPIWRRGYEGVMLNTVNGLYDYTVSQSDSILKVKNVEEHELKVIGMEAGKPGHKYENTLGALWVEYEGHQVGVGMGLSDELRNKWWANPDLIVGKTIEAECFGVSHNKQGGVSLNCAVFKRIVGAE
jgi:DNA ligase-1